MPNNNNKRKTLKKEEQVEEKNGRLKKFKKGVNKDEIEGKAYHRLCEKG